MIDRDPYGPPDPILVIVVLVAIFAGIYLHIQPWLAEQFAHLIVFVQYPHLYEGAR